MICRPMEMSSKRPVPRLKSAVPVKKVVSIKLKYGTFVKIEYSGFRFVAWL